jgi:hypothetical protein
MDYLHMLFQKKTGGQEHIFVIIDNQDPGGDFILYFIHGQ